MRLRALILLLVGAAACGPPHGAPTPDAMACPTGQIACTGVCVVADDCSFAVTSIDATSGFQNGGEWMTVHGAGFDADMRVYLADGRAPTRVLDASTALIQTPPGPVGDTDVVIQIGAHQASLPGG